MASDHFPGPKFRMDKDHVTVFSAAEASSIHHEGICRDSKNAQISCKNTLNDNQGLKYCKHRFFLIREQLLIGGKKKVNQKTRDILNKKKNSFLRS